MSDEQAKNTEEAEPEADEPCDDGEPVKEEGHPEEKAPE